MQLHLKMADKPLFVYCSKKPLLLSVVSHMQSMLTAAVKYRQSATQLYQYSALNVAHLVPEFVSWTATSDVRSIICKQVTAVNYCYCFS